MRTIKARAAIGPDHTLHLKLPDDTPTGDVDVVVVLQSDSAADRESVLDSRRKAARAARGALKDVDFSVEEFLQERREDEERRERALGL